MAVRYRTARRSKSSLCSPWQKLHQRTAAKEAIGRTANFQPSCFRTFIINRIFFYGRAALNLATNDNHHAHMIDMHYSSMNFHPTDYSKWRDQTKLIILLGLRFRHDVSKMYSLYHNDACKRCICGMYYRVPQVSNFLVVTRTRS